MVAEMPRIYWISVHQDGSFLRLDNPHTLRPSPTRNERWVAGFSCFEAG